MAANTAFATAGATGGTPGSPAPEGGSSLCPEGGRIHRAKRAAGHRRAAHDGSMQIGNVDVDAELRGAGGLGDAVEACEGPADVLPPFARLEPRLRWQLQRCRRRDEAAVGQALAIPGDDMSVVGTQIRRGDAEIPRGRVQQQLPYVGGGLSQRQEVRAHRGAGAGRLDAEDRVAVGRVDGGELDALDWPGDHHRVDFVSDVSVRNRFRGCLAGLAVGDALGTTLEFKPPGSFEPIDDVVGSGPFDLQPGQWTDDTSMALCLATSLIESGGFDPGDQMTRYVRWWCEGYLSPTGACFDIGNTVRSALSRFKETGEPFAGSLDPYSAGNGALMRLAPVPMFFAGDPAEAIERSADSSRTTHGAEEAVDACRYFSGLLVGALKGVDKATLLSNRYCPVEDHWRRNRLAGGIDAVAAGSFKGKEPPEIEGTGYVVRSLEAALWAFHRSTGFRDGALLAVNLGDAADTTGAIYGQIAGAHYGIEAIPVEWRQRLTMKAEIESLADRLHDGATRSGNQGSTSR